MSDFLKVGEMERDYPISNSLITRPANGSLTNSSDSEENVPLSIRRRSSSKKVEDQHIEETSSSNSDDIDDEDEDYDTGAKPKKGSAKKGKTMGKENGRSSKKRAISESSALSSTSDFSEEDVPLAQRRKTPNGSAKKIAVSNLERKKTPARPRKKQRKAVSSDEEKSSSEEDSEDSETQTNIKSKTAASKRKREAKEELSDSDDSDLPSASKKQKKVVADSDKDTKRQKNVAKKEESNADPSSTASPSKKGARKKKEEEEEEVYAWWENVNHDNSIKWKTLEHNGVLFPPLYEPHGVKMLYDGKEVDLEPAAEEAATWYAGVVGTVWDENPKFRKNFFEDWMEILKNSNKPCPIKEFEKCDFTPLVELLTRQKEAKKNRTKEEKLKEKEAKAQIDKVYGIAVLDGRKEKVGNFRIEPPGLFRGRGEHPKTGRIKPRVQPEEVTLNIGEDAKIPKAPEGHSWADVVHDNTKTWLATWKDFVNDHPKYVFLAATSSLKGQSDYKKFEKARELKKHIKKIRRNYEAELKDKSMEIRQRATAMYLIDKLALRAGNEKGEDEADTVGCCSLRYEHITLEPPNKVIFDFLGKDSIRYYNEVKVEEQVFKNLKIFKRDPKAEGDPVFDRLDTSSLNKHLQKYQKGLTAKVFRTYNASWTFQQQLEKTPDEASVQEKVLAYNRANREVAILCNHQRTVSKAHGGQISKLQDRVRALKYDRMKIKEEMLELEPKLKKTRPEISEEESDFDDEFIERHEVSLQEKAVEVAKRKFEKDNAKRKENGEEPLSESEMPDVKVERKPLGSMDKLEKAYTKVCERIQAAKTSLIDKDENKTTATGTSKINYIDPRISVSWCKKYGVPLEKVFNKTLIKKFMWANAVDKDWNF